MARGSNAPLTQEIPSLTGVVLGIAVDAGKETPLLDSLVVATILCDEDHHAISDAHFVFFNQLTTPELSVSQLDQALDGDTEQIEVDLRAVPAEVTRITVVVYLDEPEPVHRTLGRLRSCTIRVLNQDGNQPLLVSENLAPALDAETALQLGELYRHGPHWKFKVLGLGYDNGIAGIAADFGLTL